MPSAVSRLGKPKPRARLLNSDYLPTLHDLKAHVLSTSIDLDDDACSIESLESACGFFGLDLARARGVIARVARATATWREAARDVGASGSEIRRMESAFEHDAARDAARL